MTKPYTQRDLGYKRTPTSARMRVTFSNGEVFDVPLQIIADLRDWNYKDEEEDTVEFAREHKVTRFNFHDWFSNNMNWSDVAEYAVKVDLPPMKFDYEADFCNCDKSIEGVV